MKLFKDFKVWWLIILGISFLINLAFPNNEFKDATVMYNLILHSFGAIFGGFVLLLVPYVISIIIKRELKEKRLMIALTCSISVFWLLTIAIYFK